LLLIVMSFLLVGSAMASPIGVCGTGLAADCQTLALFGSGVTDLNYTLVAVPPAGAAPNAVTGPAYLSEQGQFPLNGPWMNNGPSSEWIVPTANQADIIPGGTYVFQTTFLLPGVFTSAVIHGQWAADNSGIDILLNGNSVGSSFPYGPPFGFAQLTSFTIDTTSWFQPGLNTLQFVVANGNGGSDTAGPSGLRVEIQDATFESPIPEPATFGLLLFGLPVALLLNRKRV
jgi:hypothetical protein